MAMFMSLPTNGKSGYSGHNGMPLYDDIRVCFGDTPIPLMDVIKSITGEDPTVENGYIIVPAMRVIFKYSDKIDITVMPNVPVSCRIIDIVNKWSIPYAEFLKMTNTILVYNESDSPVPARKYDSVGFDLYCSHDAVLPPHELVDISTGVYFSFPPHMWGLLVNRSSTFQKKLLMPTSIIDPGFQGLLKICVLNIGNQEHQVHKGDRLGQIIPMSDVPHVNLQQVESKDEFPTTERGDKGFGSTGFGIQ